MLLFVIAQIFGLPKEMIWKVQSKQSTVLIQHIKLQVLIEKWQKSKKTLLQNKINQQAARHLDPMG